MIPVENHHAIRIVLRVAGLISIRLFIDVDPCVLNALILPRKEAKTALEKPGIDVIRLSGIQKNTLIKGVCDLWMRCEKPLHDQNF